MSQSNKVIDELQNKINKISEHYDSRLMLFFYAMIGFPFLFLALVYFNPENAILIDSLIFLSFAFTLFNLFGVTSLKNERTDPLPWLFNKDRKSIKENEEEAREYVSNKDVQLEVLEFFENMPHAIDLQRLKKCFAFKDYKTALLIIEEGFNPNTDNKKEVEKKKYENKLVKEYETSLVNAKMKL